MSAPKYEIASVSETEFAKVTPKEFAKLVETRYSSDETPEATAYRKLSNMLSSEQRGGIGAPHDVMYWAWSSLVEDDPSALFKSQALFAIASTELGTPIYGSDVAGLTEAISRVDNEEPPTSEDQELLSECLKLSFKWIDVAVRTKSNRSGLKDKKCQVA